MSDLNATHIFNVYLVHPLPTGGVKRQIAGRFVQHAGEIQILEDHFGTLSALHDGPIDEASEDALANLKNSAYVDVVCQDDLDNNRRWDLIPYRDFANETPVESIQKPKGPSKFSYERDGAKHEIEFRDGQCYLNGQHLDETEAKRLLEHHKTGVARLSHVKDGQE